MFRPRFRFHAGLASLMLAALAVALPAAAQNDKPPPQAEAPPPEPFEAGEIRREAEEFFGAASEGLAKAIEKAFRDYGRPVAYITGEEASGAIGVGLRYGQGQLHYKDGSGRKVYWQGPSIGWDLGANASKVFTLVYNLRSTDQLFQRFPGVDGSVYIVGGVGMNYQRSGNLVLAPIRTGVGLRAGANVGYLQYTPEKSINPF